MAHDWLGGKTVEKEIDGTMVTFYRIPAGTLRKFNAIAGLIGKSLGVLFDSREHDSRQERIQVPSEFRDDNGPLYEIKSTVDAVDPKIAEVRRAQVEEGIEKFINTLVGPEAMTIMCEIIGRSAREEFKDYKDDYSKLQDILDPMTMFQMLKGAWEASAGDFAELGKSLFLQNPKVQEAVNRLKTKS